MTKVFQIVAKGIASNRIVLKNYTDYATYKRALEVFMKHPLFIVITTNMFVDE